MLYRFTGTGGDGAAPQAALIRDAAGNLYGTTSSGGGGACGSGCGTVFKLNKNRKETVLYRFGGGTDGAYPYAALVRDSSGNLYGNTYSGGHEACPPGGCGVVFKLDNTGKETILHRFSGGRDGGNPWFAALIRDKTGNLYGTTFLGGDLTCNPPVGCGAVFKIGKTGETVLHRFTETDGANPLSGLTRDSIGNLYGTTYAGGSSNQGVVFKIARQ